METLPIECAFFLKRASLYNEERDVEKSLRLCHEVVSKWKEIGVDFQNNCVFVDEAGFNTHMIRGRACSEVREPAYVTIYKQRGAKISIVGYSAFFVTVNFSKVETLTKAKAKAGTKVCEPWQQEKKKTLKTFIKENYGVS